MSPEQAYEKCLNENRRIPELEGIIATDHKYSYLYVLHVIEGPFEKGEKEISKHPYYSYRYALCVIRGPWERGENIISKDPHASYLYARDVIQGPFDKCHHTIFNSKFKDNYIEFLKLINYDMSEISEWLL